MTEDRLVELLELLEHRTKGDQELVLSIIEHGRLGETMTYDLSDPYLGITEEFLGLIKNVCPTPNDWRLVQAAMAVELAKSQSALADRMLALSEKLWVEARYGELRVFHKAFPFLDGGGSSQASAFLLFLKKQFPKLKVSTLFEWCCGPAFLGFLALHSGFCEELVLADINPHVVSGIEKTIAVNGLTGRVRYYISDNLRAIPAEEKFDLVLGNPPWAYREIENLANPLIPNDPGWRIHQGFFTQIKPYLTDGALMCISAYEPFLKEAYVDFQKEPWDVRPNPPIFDFRRFIEEGCLNLIGVYKPDCVAEVGMDAGMSFLLVGNQDHPEPKTPELDLIGFGGKRDEEEAPEPWVPELSFFGSKDLKACLLASQTLEGLRYTVGRAFESKHLTQVLTELFQDPGNEDLEVLQALGIPPEVVQAFCGWGLPHRFSYAGPEPGFRLRGDTCRENLSAIRLQLTQDAPVCVGLKLVCELLSCLDGGVRLSVTVKPGFDEDSVRHLLGQFPGYDSQRVEFLEIGHQTMFAQDNGLLGAKSDGTPAVIVPFALSGHRPGDTLPDGVLQSVQSRLHWEGGNLLCDGQHIFVGANSVAKNMRSLGLTKHQVMQAFSEEMGFEAHILGDLELALNTMARMERGRVTRHAVDAGQADFHIDLDCCLLGAKSSDGQSLVALADPLAGLNYLRDVLAKKDLFAGHFLPLSGAKRLFQRCLEKSIARRLPLLSLYKSQLLALGYQVVTIPDVRLVSDENYLARTNFNFGYCNALSLSHRGVPTVCLLKYGVERLELAVEERYASAGVQVTWIGDANTANDVASMRGGLHCFCSAHY